MSKERDDELNQSGFSLEEILAEFGSGAEGGGSGEEKPATGPEAPADSVPSGERERCQPPQKPDDGTREPDWREDTIPFPVRPRQPEGPSGGRKKGSVTRLPPRPEHEPAVEEPEDDGEPEEELPEEPDTDETKVLEFPQPEPENPVAAGLDRLRRKADEFAEHMYEDEGMEEDAEVRRAEKLIPGVDEEEIPAAPVHRPRRTLPPAPDTPAAELFHRYSRGLKSLRLRTSLVFLLFLGLLYITLAEQLPLPLPDAVAASAALRCYVQTGLQMLAMLLGVDVLMKGLVKPFRLRMGLDCLVSLANLAVLADGITLPTLAGGTPFRQPYGAAAVLALWCVMLGSLRKQEGQRLACRTAAAAHEPYLVTRDEGAWNGKDTYAKWSGPVSGFGSQIQGEDGAERVFRIAAPILLLACILFSLISSLGHNRPQDVLWCLSATLTAASSLSATLCFGLPWRKLSARLSKLGAALAGWDGVVNTTGSSNLLVTDSDLFPRGAVVLNGVKIYGDFPVEKVVAYTATVIRDSGCGLEQTFHDMLRAQGLLYRKGDKFTAYEGGGVSEEIRGSQVLVGSAAFMALMEVALPRGLNVKNAVFCAIDGHLAGLFALNYRLSSSAAGALDSLICNHITPVLATRDFNLIPSMLRQRFKLPVDRMEFPPVERRRALSDPGREHSDSLTAVLCREGVGPYADAVVGGCRLRRAVRLSAVLACLGSAAGCLLAFYLTFIQAYSSLTPVNLLVFLLLWLVPTPLLSGWVDRY